MPPCNRCESEYPGLSLNTKNPCSVMKYCLPLAKAGNMSLQFLVMGKRIAPNPCSEIYRRDSSSPDVHNEDITNIQAGISENHRGNFSLY